MSKQNLEIFLFKNRLNSKNLIDILNLISDETAKLILNDLEKDLNNNKLDDDNKTIKIFTDGGCVNNGRIGSRAAYSVYFPTFNHLDETILLQENPTNQRAELSAILHAFEIIQDNINLFNNNKIIIYTDSSYSIKCITEWTKTWKHNGWKTANGKDVKNREIIQSISNIIENLADKIKIQFKHVFSHTTEPKKSRDSSEYQIWLGNKIVDERIQNILKFKK